MGRVGAGGRLETLDDNGVVAFALGRDVQGQAGQVIGPVVLTRPGSSGWQPVGGH